MKQSRKIIALDVGGRRIGVAIADSIARIASPLCTLDVDGTEITHLKDIISKNEITDIVVGLPRNMSGEETKQSQEIRNFVDSKIKDFKLPIHFQDESMTSVMAEEYLSKKNKNKIINKGDIDSHAASIILQDYIESL